MFETFFVEDELRNRTITAKPCAPNSKLQIGSFKQRILDGYHTSAENNNQGIILDELYKLLIIDIIAQKSKQKLLPKVKL